MKVIWLISFLFSLSLASQSQIILGNFENIDDAKKMQEEVSEFIKETPKFENFLYERQLILNTKKNIDYFIVTIEPFNDIVTQLSVLRKIRSKFSDAYVIELTNSEKMLATSKELSHKFDETNSRFAIIKNNFYEIIIAIIILTISIIYYIIKKSQYEAINRLESSKNNIKYKKQLKDQTPLKDKNADVESEPIVMNNIKEGIKFPEVAQEKE